MATETEPKTKNVHVTDFPVDILEKLREEVRTRWDDLSIRLHLRVSDGDAISHGARCWANRERQTIEPAAPAAKDGAT